MFNEYASIYLFGIFFVISETDFEHEYGWLFTFHCISYGKFLHQAGVQKTLLLKRTPCDSEKAFQYPEFVVHVDMINDFLVVMNTLLCRFYFSQYLGILVQQTSL